MEELKRCPFCGGEATMVKCQNSRKPLWHIVCTVCGEMNNWRCKKEEATTTWNRRASGWIPVSERKPTKEDTNQDGYVMVWDGCDMDFHTPDYAVEYCTHWMPLPSPPKEQI